MRRGPCAINCTNLRGYGMHCFHPGVCGFVMADASVRFVSEATDPRTIAAHVTSCTGEVLPDSVLFCGRHVYLKAVMLLVVAARQRQLSPTSMGKLKKDSEEL